jgi:tetratricopeptide (TPR) repeat protein
MLKRTFLLVITIFFALAAKAQSADSVYNQYLDFNLARLQGDQDKTLELGESILPNANKLPEKTRISFYFAAGKMYEDNDQPDKALPYYEKVVVAAPDYYVVHRALGYIYLDKSKQFQKQISASAGDKTMVAQLTTAYTNAVRKALPHLEKAQACDPSDDTLVIIKILYKNINDTAALNSLDARLKEQGRNCIDILTDR